MAQKCYRKCIKFQNGPGDPKIGRLKYKACKYNCQLDASKKAMSKVQSVDCSKKKDPEKYKEKQKKALEKAKEKMKKFEEKYNDAKKELDNLK